MDFDFVFVACCCIVRLLFQYFVVSVCMFVEESTFAGYAFCVTLVFWLKLIIELNSTNTNLSIVARG